MLASRQMTEICKEIPMAKIISQFKKCSRCKVVKSILEFRKIKRRGRIEAHSRCSNCERLAGREWASRNKDKLREKSRRHYRKNREESIRKSLKWYKDHPEEARRMTREFHARHPGRRKFWDKRYYENNKDAFILNGHIRRARVKKSGGIISRKEWKELKEQFGNRCINPECKDPYKKPLTLDHVVPIVLGGENVIQNAQPLCKSCNSRKNTKVIDYRKLHV